MRPLLLALLQCGLLSVRRLVPWRPARPDSPLVVRTIPLVLQRLLRLGVLFHVLLGSLLLLGLVVLR